MCLQRQGQLTSNVEIAAIAYGAGVTEHIKTIKMNIAKLNQAYEEMCDPKYIRSIQSDEQFKQWCNVGTIEDLECALLVFEKHEMYEDCLIIKRIINEKEILGHSSR